MVSYATFDLLKFVNRTESENRNFEIFEHRRPGINEGVFDDTLDNWLSVFRVLSVEEGFLLLLPPPPCNTSTKTSRRSCRVCQSKNWSRSLERAEPMETESLRQTLLGDSCPDQPVHRSQLCKQLALLRDLAVRALAAASRLLELGHLQVWTLTQFFSVSFW